MNTPITSIAAVLNSLIEVCKDGQAGFSAAAEHVENADFKSLFIELAMQRQQFVTELQTFVAGLGRQPEENGTVSGALHRGWLDFKAVLSAGDVTEILADCERGEDAAVEEYRQALEHEEFPTDVLTAIRRQYLNVQAAHDRVRDLRDRFQGD